MEDDTAAPTALARGSAAAGGGGGVKRKRRAKPLELTDSQQESQEAGAGEAGEPGMSEASTEEDEEEEEEEDEDDRPLLAPSPAREWYQRFVGKLGCLEEAMERAVNDWEALSQDDEEPGDMVEEAVRELQACVQDFPSAGPQVPVVCKVIA